MAEGAELEGKAQTVGVAAAALDERDVGVAHRPVAGELLACARQREERGEIVLRQNPSSRHGRPVPFGVEFKCYAAAPCANCDLQRFLAGFLWG